jgi:hypothetical protein
VECPEQIVQVDRIVKRSHRQGVKHNRDAVVVVLTLALLPCCGKKIKNKNKEKEKAKK